MLREAMCKCGTGSSDELQADSAPMRVTRHAFQKALRRRFVAVVGVYDQWLHVMRACGENACTHHMQRSTSLRLIRSKRFVLGI